MKKLIILLIILLAVNLVYAEDQDNSTLKKIDTLKFSETTKIIIAERDALRVLFKDKEHIIHVRSLNEKNNAAQLTIFIDGAPTPYYLTLSKDLFIRLDFERDDNIDAILKFDSIKDNKVSMILELVKNGTITNKPLQAIENKASKSNLIIGVIIILFIVIIGSLIFIILNKTKKKSED